MSSEKNQKDAEAAGGFESVCFKVEGETHTHRKMLLQKGKKKSGQVHSTAVPATGQNLFIFSPHSNVQSQKTQSKRG